MSTTLSLSNSSKLLSNSITSISSSPSGPSLSMVFLKLITSGSSEGEDGCHYHLFRGARHSRFLFNTYYAFCIFFHLSFRATFHNLFYQLLGNALVSLVNKFSTYVLPGSTMSIGFLVSLSSLYTLSKFNFLCRRHLIILSFDHVLSVEQFWSY